MLVDWERGAAAQIHKNLRVGINSRKFHTSKNFKWWEVSMKNAKKSLYREISMVLGNVFCAYRNESGEVHVKVYNEKVNDSVAYFTLSLSGDLSLVRTSYPTQEMDYIYKATYKELKFILEEV